MNCLLKFGAFRGSHEYSLDKIPLSMSRGFPEIFALAEILEYLVDADDLLQFDQVLLAVQ